MPSKSTVKVELTVAWVNHGGNAVDGTYFYSYSPTFVSVTEHNTPIEYSMHNECADRYEIQSYALNDPTNQMTDIKLSNGVLSMVNLCNKDNQLIQLSILVLDKKTGVLIDADPQVTNTPPPE